MTKPDIEIRFNGKSISKAWGILAIAIAGFLAVMTREVAFNPANAEAVEKIEAKVDANTERFHKIDKDLGRVSEKLDLLLRLVDTMREEAHEKKRR